MSIELTKLIADFDTQLAAPVSIGGTTATLVSVTDDDGNTIPNGTYGFTIDAGNSAKEYIICTLTSTALTAVLSVSRQGVTSSGFAKAHRRGAKVTLTDWSSIKAIQNVLETGYASAHTPSTDYELATKKYVDSASFIGATNASTTTPGVVELPTQAEVDAGTASGGLGPLVVTPDTLRARQYNDYAVDSVGTDSYAITVTPAITAYAAGQQFTFKAGTANTGACSLNVNSLGAKTIKKDVSSDLATGDILANQIITVVYDGTNMQLTSEVSGLLKTPAPVFSSGTATKNLADASTTQNIAHGLGKIPNKVIFNYCNPAGNNSATTYNLHGVYDGTNSISIITNIGVASTASYSSTTVALAIPWDGAVGGNPYSGGNNQTAVITWDATNIIITWTKHDTPAGTVTFMWEAQG